MNIIERVIHYPPFQKYPALAEFVKFGIVGVSGTIVDFGIYAIFTRVFGVYYIAARAVSVFAAIINNFLLNKHWTFNRGNSGRTAQESWKFFLVSIIGYAMNLGIMYIVKEYTPAERIFGENEDFFAIVVAIGIVLFFNYFGNKYWTFGNSSGK
ncbi:MAG: GtrA family protein [Patescibacteria group bacterium]|nr:GtrA family protein [Patescibacteria group bacterium]MDD5715152.1 GtrA family protein [Patescibacteria group bacterium]